MSRVYDQREDLHALGKMGQRRVLGGYQPIEGGPIGAPPTGGSGAQSPAKSAAESRARAAKEREEEMRLAAEARTTPVNAICECCGWVWPVAYLPLPISRAAALMGSAACPKGCEARVLCKTLTGE